MISIKTNVPALRTQKNLNQVTSDLSNIMTRMSSGLKITGPQDNAAQADIASKLSGQISGYTKIGENIENAKSAIAIAEGSLGIIQNDLMRINELILQVADDGQSITAKNALMEEVKTRLEGIEQVASTCSFNNSKLLDGTIDAATNPFVIQIGLDTDFGATVRLNSVDISNSFTNAHLSQIGGAVTPDIRLPEILDPVSPLYDPKGDNVRPYLTCLQNAINDVSTKLGNMGASSNRLTTLYDNADSIILNSNDAKSRITDIDFAKESSDLTTKQILQQVNGAILTQANSMNDLALSLLQ